MDFYLPIGMYVVPLPNKTCCCVGFEVLLNCSFWKIDPYFRFSKHHHRSYVSDDFVKKLSDSEDLRMANDSWYSKLVILSAEVRLTKIGFGFWIFFYEFRSASFSKKKARFGLKRIGKIFSFSVFQVFKFWVFKYITTSYILNNIFQYLKYSTSMYKKLFAFSVVTQYTNVP